MRYALFLGCTIPVRGMNYEISARKTAEVLGIEFVDINDFSCCGFPVKSVSREASLLLAARNLAIAEGEGLNICTLCSACTSVLTEANKELKEDELFRAEVNRKLAAIGKRYDGKVEVKHFSRVLYEDVGVEGIKEKLRVEFPELRFAAHYGCHYLKPSEIYDGFDDPENPRSLDDLIIATGAESVFYEDKKQCCGGGILGVDEDTALAISKLKLDHVKSAEVDAIVLICPFCSVMYDRNQRRIERKYEAEYRLPVLYYPQVLGIALGIPWKELGFKLNVVKPREMLKKAGLL
jgi:heterodisulfide reductase subunit B